MSHSIENSPLSGSLHTPYHQESLRSAKVTAIALAAVALVLTALSCVLWGVGTSPGMMLTGMNFFPYLAGTFLGAISMCVGAGSLIFAVKMAYHKYKVQTALPPQF
jgi:hypothetical protein